MVHGTLRQAGWAGLVLLAGCAGAVAFGCGVPLAGLVAIAAVTLDPLPALALVGLLFVANRLIEGPVGAGWMGAVALILPLMLGAARRIGRRAGPIGAFLAAFAVYEAGLMLAAGVLGGASAFAPGLVALALAQNAVGFVALWLVASQFGMASLPARAGRHARAVLSPSPCPTLPPATP